MFRASFNRLFGAPGSFRVGNVRLATLSASDDLPPAAVVRGLVKTPTAYLDDNVVSVSYAVSDHFGRTACSAAGATVSVTVGSFSGQCTPFTAADPSGVCTVSIPQTAFAPSAARLPVTVTVSYLRVPAAVGSLGDVSLSPPAQRAPATLPGVYALVPQLVAFAGDSVTVALWAQTGGAQLTSWALTLRFNASGLSFVGASAPLFSTPVVNSNTPGALTLVATGLNPLAEPAAVSGFLQIASVTFSVREAAVGANQARARKRARWPLRTHYC